VTAVTCVAFVRKAPVTPVVGLEYSTVIRSLSHARPLKIYAPVSIGARTTRHTAEQSGSHSPVTPQARVAADAMLLSRQRSRERCDTAVIAVTACRDSLPQPCPLEHFHYYYALAEIPCVWPFFGGTATSSALPPVYTNSEKALRSSGCPSDPCTQYPAPCTLYPAPCNLQPATCNL
jgi:hypothetical protein